MNQAPKDSHVHNNYKDMSKIYQRYTKHISKLFQRYSKDMQNIYQRYANYMPRVIPQL